METEIKKLQERIRKLEQERDAHAGQLYAMAGFIGALVATCPDSDKMLASALSVIENRIERARTGEELLPFIISDPVHQAIHEAHCEIRIAARDMLRQTNQKTDPSTD